jgi:hypothetical protein
MRGPVLDRDARDVPEWRPTVDRSPESVEHAPEQLGPDGYRGRALGGMGAVTGAHAAEITERHAHERVVTYGHDFGDHRTVVGGDRDGAPDREVHAFDFEIESEHARDAPRNVRLHGVEHGVEEEAHCSALGDCVAGPLGPRSLLGGSFGVPDEKLCFSWG